MTFCRKTVEETYHEVKIIGECSFSFMVCCFIPQQTTQKTESYVDLCIKFITLKWGDFFWIVIKDAEIQPIIKNNHNSKQ